MKEFIEELSKKSQHQLDTAIFESLKRKGIATADIFLLGERGRVVVTPDGTNTLIIDNTINVCCWKALTPVMSSDHNSVKITQEYQFQDL